MRTVTYTELKNRFTSAIGVDSLLSVEETAFQNSLNDRVKGAWTRARWPELMSLKEKTVAAVSSPIAADKAVQIDNDSDIMDVRRLRPLSFPSATLARAILPVSMLLLLGRLMNFEKRSLQPIIKNPPR